MLSFAWPFVSSDCEVFHDFSGLVPVSFVKLAVCVCLPVTSLWFLQCAMYY